jgi:hypothetical protein
MFESFKGGIGRLHSALDSIEAEDLHAIPRSQLLERAAKLVRARNVIEAELVRASVSPTSSRLPSTTV